MKFVCEATGNEYPMITSLINPATGTEVLIEPPFQWSEMQELGAFLTNFERYCISGWMLGGLDPSVISSSHWLPDFKSKDVSTPDDPGDESQGGGIVAVRDASRRG